LSDFNFAELEELTMRAFLATTEFEIEADSTGRVERRRMSDQARRLGLLICRVTFGRKPPQEGLWLRSHAWLAECLEIDPSDCRKALDRLVTFRLLEEEPRGEWVYLTLTPGRLTLHARALGARDAWSRLEAAQTEAREMLARCDDERRDAGMRPALAAVDREEAVRVGLQSADSYRGDSPKEARRWASIIGEIPRNEGPPIGEIPRQDRGDSPIFTNPPSRAGARVRGDSLADRQIANRTESGAVAQDGKPGRFRDEESNWIVAELERLSPEEWRNEMCRRTWIGRVRDHKDLLVDPERALIGEVKHMKNMGAVKKSPLGVLFTMLRKAGREVGRHVNVLCF
jgi:hypothetical protein